MSDVCQRLRERVQRLRGLAGARSEAVLLRAAVLLEVRPDAQTCPRLAESIALHYLLLADHAEVRAQPGLSDRYRARAQGWVEQVERGQPTLSGFLERARADA